MFRHALVRSAAYELQLPGARAELHALVVRLGLEFWGLSDEALAREQLQWRQAEARQSGLDSDASAQKTLNGCEEIVLELEAAEKQQRTPLLFRGFLPRSLKPQLRLALLAHMQQHDPAAYAEMVRHKALHDAMLEGTQGQPVPDWRDETPV